jgi:hypothetical protein
MPIRQLEQRGTTPEADIATFWRFLEQFRSIPILYGQLVSVPMKTGDIIGRAFHSLGGPYRGGFVASQTGGGFAESVAIVESATAKALGYGDPAKQVVLTTGRPLLVDKMFLIWLF